MPEKSKNSKKSGGMKSFIGGTILTDDRITKQLPFLLFLAFMGIMLITNRNWSERTIRQIEVLQDELDELRSESKTMSAKLMGASRPSEVAKKVEDANIGLQEPVKPPQKLIVQEK
ncbi:MAG: hypothetical protein HQ522_06265 [Bacteroidetes bacterium]|nr:hypothetical protein [Bacteroidota bacterium]